MLTVDKNAKYQYFNVRNLRAEHLESYSSFSYCMHNNVYQCSGPVIVWSTAYILIIFRPSTTGTKTLRECSGSVVESLTRDRRAPDSSLTDVTALWSLSKTYLS